MPGHIGAVALNTFRETARDKIFYIVAVFGLVMVASSAVLSPLTIGAQGKIVADVGIASVALFGLLVVVLVGSSMVRKELDKRTITTILTKPVNRRDYLLGKFCGLNLTVFCLIAIMGAIFTLVMVISRVPLHPEYLAVFYLSFLELTLINAAVVLFSTFASPALAAVFTLCLFVIGHLSESVMRFGQVMGGAVQVRVTEAIYYLVPNLEMFNIRGAVVHGDPVSGLHLGLATVYGLCYTALLLLLANQLFRRKELR